ncbi:MAG: PorT family protein [Bacteroidota bacterium]|nr:PorT family protein [Bacteroidota bacterium]MDX5429339.1 PorT family protein [Bacteroidota bacterium]MDX5448970.1 PorT family protein [Bacteroidota bacterium]MDX5506939.1 PorT family protein [Bacteroidota bacterium]
MTNRDLERLFRKKLNDRDFEFNPAAWNRMASMLDAQPPVTGFWNSARIAGVAAVAMIGISAGIIGFGHSGPSVDPQYMPGPGISFEMQDQGTLMQTGLEALIQPGSEAQSSTNEGSDPEMSTRIAGTPSSPSVPMGSSPGFQRTSQATGQTSPIREVATISERDVQIPIDLDRITPEFDQATSLQEFTRGEYWGDGLRSHNRIDPSIFLVAGANIASAWTGNLESGPQGPAFYLGVHARQYVQNAWFLELGVDYSARQGINSTYSSSEVTYDFGYRKTTDISHGRMGHFLELPILFGKGFGRHDISIGPRVSYMASMSSEVERKVETDFSTSWSSFNSHSYQDPYRKWDVGLSLSYEYSLNPNLGIQVSGYYGLLDQTRDQLIGVEQFDRNLYLRFGLTYQPF